MSTSVTADGGAARPGSRTLGERLLSPVADVRREEIASALLVSLTMFIVLGGYYLLKTAREMFILVEGGAEVKSYSSAGQALLLLAIVPAYGAIASRVNRMQLVLGVTLFFAFNLVLFLLALQAGWRIGVVYFLWLGIFNVTVIAQFWAFAADLFTEEQGKRIFPLIGVGASLGAWAGSLRAGQLVESWGAPRLLIGGIACLIVCAVLIALANRVAGRNMAGQSQRSHEKLAEGPNGIQLIRSDRYLMLIAALVVLLNVVNTSGEYLFGRYVLTTAEAQFGAGPEGEAAVQQFVGASYSSYFSYISLVGFLLQLFAVSRIFKFLGVGRSLLIHPIVAIASYVFMLRAPSFELIRVLKITDNSINYSLGNTTMQALWLPTSRETKYKAKQAVDSVCVRGGDVLQAGVVYAGELSRLSISGFAAVNVCCAVGWLAVALGLRRQIKRRASAAGAAEF
jgi:AAA family ATP:ADP antiporter